MDETSSPDALVAAYQEIRPRYERFGCKLEGLLHELLTGDALRYAYIDRRTKTVESFAAKAVRTGRNYESPLTDILDLTGIRIVAPYLSDVARVHELIGRNFAIDPGHSVRKADDMAPDRFGHRADHLVIRLLPSRAAQPEWEEFRELPAEIQVCTFLQHAWTRIDGELRYKREADVPDEVKRTLFRLSALLELADEQFEFARSRREAVANEYQALVARGELRSVCLDADSIRAYLAAGRTYQHWQSVATKAGFGPVESDDAALEARRQRDGADLLRVLRATECHTLGDLQSFLEDAASWALPALSQIAVSWSSENPNPLTATTEGVLTLLVLCRVRSASHLSEELYEPRLAETIRLIRERIDT